MDIKIFVGIVFSVVLISNLETVNSYYFVGLVRFANNICTTLQSYTGTCYRRKQCTEIGGVESGVCANGIGRCCLFQGTCGDSSSHNNTYFTNNNYPNPQYTASQCVFTVVPCSGICQIRLDFLSLTLSQPDGSGNCIYDSLVITGAGTTVPVICGENSGQHMYLLADGTNAINIVISVSSAVAFGRSWNIKVTQIACDCPTLAPSGCLQYYTEASGTVNSFNYGTDLNGNTVDFGNGTIVAGTRQIANLNYGICIGALPGYCSIRWAQASDDVSFTLSADTAAVAVDTGLPGSGFTGENCVTDFVVIPNPYYTNGTAVGSDRFCGNQFASVVTSSRPFVLTVITDANENADAANRGFSLTYTQQVCSNLAYLFLTS